MFRQIMQAVKHMHGKLICHRDLKLDNILIMDNGKPKIIDFGFAIQCELTEKLKISCGTLAYMAPEVV